MSNTMNLAQLAIQTNFTKLQASANNIANLNSDGYKNQRVNIEAGPNDTPTTRIAVDPSPGPSRMELNREGEMVEVEMSNVDLATEYVNSMEASQAIKANLKTIQTAAELLGEIIDQLA